MGWIRLWPSPLEARRLSLSWPPTNASDAPTDAGGGVDPLGCAPLVAGVGSRTPPQLQKRLSVLRDERPRPIDPLVERAADLLTRAMVASRDRETLWSEFRAMVVEQLARLDEAPVRDALDELERRGVNLELLARLAEERHRALIERRES